MCYGCLKKSQKDRMMLVPYDNVIKYDKIFNNILKIKRKFENDMAETIQKNDPKLKKNPVYIFFSSNFNLIL